MYVDAFIVNERKLFKIDLDKFTVLMYSILEKWQTQKLGPHYPPKSGKAAEGNILNCISETLFHISDTFCCNHCQFMGKNCTEKYLKNYQTQKLPPLSPKSRTESKRKHSESYKKSILLYICKIYVKI